MDFEKVDLRLVYLSFRHPSTVAVLIERNLDVIIVIVSQNGGLRKDDRRFLAEGDRLSYSCSKV
ncbi:MAG: hypothetical protein V7K57_00325 [Nostoc sp.]|uniref:hypothetical protein n=1 Tax=Nostoc sp. TaxID=1180 RepID=UPI002FF77CB2